jgi:uncharacterized surface anchored protein
MLGEIRQILIVTFAILLTGIISMGATATRTADEVLAGGDTGTLSVAVFDTSGKRVVGANVVLFDSAGAVAGQGTTGSNGKAVFSDLAAGDYSIFASKVVIVFGFPIGMFGTGNATVTAGGTTGAVVVLDRYTY